jgi:hypothetical protein
MTADRHAACVAAAWAVTGIDPVAKLLLIAMAMSVTDSGYAPVALHKLAATLNATVRETERAMHALMMGLHITVIGAAGSSTVAQVHPNGVNA